MKSIQQLKYGIIVSAIALVFSQAAANEEQMTKPGGAIGMGKDKVGQAKSNLFW